MFIRTLKTIEITTPYVFQLTSDRSKQTTNLMLLVLDDSRLSLNFYKHSISNLLYFLCLINFNKLFPTELTNEHGI